MSKLNLVRGTRVLTGADASLRRTIINTAAEIVEMAGYEEIVLPSLEYASVYSDKAGAEVLGQMYVFPDRKGRELCLRPEGTATCQLLAPTCGKNTKLWYATTCWRYERPQAGRYREFTQFGVEVLNPDLDFTSELIELAEQIVKTYTTRYDLHQSVKRGLAYYEGDGFEITCSDLGAQKQVCGGGRYREGIGFAIGVDRLMLASAGYSAPHEIHEDVIECIAVHRSQCDSTGRCS